MDAYRIDLSDRQRARIVLAESASDAIAAAVGKRFCGARHDHDCATRDGAVVSSRYQVTVQTGPSRGGATPVSGCWATVRRGAL